MPLPQKRRRQQRPPRTQHKRQSMTPQRKLRMPPVSIIAVQHEIKTHKMILYSMCTVQVSLSSPLWCLSVGFWSLKVKTHYSMFRFKVTVCFIQPHLTCTSRIQSGDLAESAEAAKEEAKKGLQCCSILWCNILWCSTPWCILTSKHLKYFVCHFGN